MGLWLPSRVMHGATALCMVAVAVVLWAVLSPPWLGLTLGPAPTSAGSAMVIDADASGPSAAVSPSARLLAVNGLPVVAEDLAEEPDMFETYAQVEGFMARQTALAAALRAPQVRLSVDAPEGARMVVIKPARRPLGDLPSAFWVQLATGAGALLIGGCVLAVRPGEATTRLFALSGAMVALSAFAAAIYSSRELAIDGGLFRLLSALNHVGALGFGVAMVALFALYPKRIAPPRLLWLLPAIFGPWVVLDTLHLAGSPTMGQALPTIILMLGIIAAVAAQAFVNRRDPRARAALSWLGLSVIIGAGAFVALIVAPLLVQASPAIEQGHAFGFFLLIYAGLALGVSRYRLFDMSEWAFRVIFYTGAVLLLFGVDAALILFLGLQRATSIGIALPLVGFAYLPLRGVMWDRVVGRRALREHELFQSVIDVSLAATPAERSQRWRGLLQRLFDPLAIEEVEGVDQVAIREEGMSVAIPPAGDGPALLLRFPWRGRRLFSTANQELARELVRLMRYTEESRAAYERGGLEERQRIARDLHDDVGSRLLSGLYKTDLREAQRAMREAMADIRTIVSALSVEQPPLDRVVAALRHETAERLRSAGVELSWPLAAVEEQSLALDYRVFRCLTTAHREAISNVIRHAAASRVEVSLIEEGGRLRMRVSDDGVGVGVGVEGAASEPGFGGNGLRGLSQRLEAIGGAIAVTRLDRGTALEITLPLQPAVETSAAGHAAPQAG